MTRQIPPSYLSIHQNWILEDAPFIDWHTCSFPLLTCLKTPQTHPSTLFKVAGQDYGGALPENDPPPFLPMFQCHAMAVKEMSSDDQTIPSTATISLLFNPKRNLMAASSTTSSDTTHILWFYPSKCFVGLAHFYLPSVSLCKKSTFHALQIKSSFSCCISKSDAVNCLYSYAEGEWLWGHTYCSLHNEIFQ